MGVRWLQVRTFIKEEILVSYVLKRRGNGLVAEGWHDTVIQGVDVEHGVQVYWGESDRLRVSFALEGEDRTLIQRYLAHLASTSELGKMVGGLLGRLPEELDIGNLVNMKCRIRVAHGKGKDGRVWANVVEVQRRGQRQ